MSGTPKDWRTPEDHERSAAMDADIVELRREGTQWVEIGRLMAIKYPRTHGANGVDVTSDEPYRKQYMYNRWRDAIAAVPAKKVEEHRAELNERLESLIGQVERIARKDHLAHSNGRVVELRGEPVIDDGPKLAAFAELRKLMTEIRQLNGLTVPVKQELGLNATVKYEVVGVDVEKMK